MPEKPEKNKQTDSAEQKKADKPKVVEEKSKTENFAETSVLLKSGAKMAKVVFFSDDDEQEERSSKKKVSDVEEKPTASMRHRASLAEETPEELYARVIQELQEENLRFTKECSNQLCTKCCRNLVSPEYRRQGFGLL